MFLHPRKSNALNGRSDSTPWILTLCLAVAVHWGKCSSIFVAVVFLCHHYFVLSSKFSRKTRHLQLNLRGVSRFWRPIFYCPNLSSHPCFSPPYCCWWWLLKITEISQILIIDSWVSFRMDFVKIFSLDRLVAIKQILDTNVICRFKLKRGQTKIFIFLNQCFARLQCWKSV